MKRSYYSSQIGTFLHSKNDPIVELTQNHPFDLKGTQRDSWLASIEILREALSSFQQGHLLLEYAIPRMGKRVDIVILLSGLVIPIEFKQNATAYDAYAIDQVMDYSLDLKNFQAESHFRKIFPIVLASDAPTRENTLCPYDDLVFAPLFANTESLGEVISLIMQEHVDAPICPEEWEESAYSPTPTIIEAAQALYKKHHVKDISRSDSGAINLHETSNCLSQIIEDAKQNHKKAICFVTGVPGAGKTLAGLNIANERHNCDEGEHAVFLSGNGPLVAVLQEALARDKVAEAREKHTRIRITEARRATKAFIQNIHHFRDASLGTEDAPIEKVAIFDEAQRAWTLEQTRKFMAAKKSRPNFNHSEPDFLISVMDRHEDWCVIVCLIGGGQEINTGEAGLPEWFRAIRENYSHWHVYASPQLTEFEYTQGTNLFSNIIRENLNHNSSLHLSVSVRSFRSELLSKFVKTLLDCKQDQARELFERLGPDYPICVTRNVDRAKQWLIEKARGSERYGLLAYSGSQRLRPHGIQVKSKADPCLWFLNGKDDVRSSYYLEEVATEFEIQGLELDWACLAWDANLRFNGTEWEYRAFKGTKWQNVNDKTRKMYMKNAYRVLLTRARQGMVIFVPEGNDSDQTRKSHFYDSIYDYLLSIGLPSIE
ncbi:MAG: DUF2075 domain-containing protein [Phycisphaerales bacterium]|nr:DUF2075 domain-containing protein [Phycisphaerales bacterium]MBT7012591.1 DUF2075 domain-containing protein [Planctomycetota bacterium]